MKTWHILTSKKEQSALPCRCYLLVGSDASTENGIIQSLRNKLQNGGEALSAPLKANNIPEYTCAVQRK